MSELLAAAAAAPAAVPAETTENGNGAAAAADAATAAELAAGVAAVKVEHDPAAVDASAEAEAPGEISSFRELPLSDALFRGIEEECKFDAPFSIQRQKLPEILGEPPRSSIIQAPSGSGKTVCFVLGMLHRIDVSQPTTQALCVVPTREIANQIWEMCMRPMSRYMEGLQVCVFVAATKISRVTQHIVIGTPKSVANAVKKRALSLEHVNVFVLDEADKMMDDRNGHRQEALQITKRLPNTVQALLFSATFTQAVVDFSRKIITNINGDASVVPLRVATRIPANVKQLKVNIQGVSSENQRAEFLKAIFRVLTVQQSIIFVQTKRTCREVAASMQREGYSVDMLNGDLLPDERDTVVRRFRAGEFKVLVTTNVLARGVDFEGVSMVVNYEPPQAYANGQPMAGEPEYDEYVHRVGRTGRAGRNGVAVNFVNCRLDNTLYRKLEERYGPKEGPAMIEEVPVDVPASATAEEIREALERFADNLEEIVETHRAAGGNSV